MLFAAGRRRGEQKKIGGTEPPVPELATASSHDRDPSIAILNGILDAAGANPDTRQLMRAALEQLRAWTSCEAGGIRLEEAGDYPYVIEQGFPARYVGSDNSLWGYDSDGKPIRDDQGRPVLECACGEIIRERTPTDHPAFTSFGSFWTGSTSKLAADPTDSLRQAQLRKRCGAGGYESVAIIPLRAGGEVFGLLQLNSKKKNRITEEVMAVLEPLVALFASMLKERIANETLRGGHALREILFATIKEAFAYFRLIHGEDGEPQDFVVEAANEAFKALFSVSDPVGKKISELDPTTDERSSSLVDMCARVVETRMPEQSEEYYPHLDRWLDARVSSPVRDHVLTVFEDISERKQAEDTLRRTQFSLDQVTDYLTWVDVEGRICEVSESTCRKLEYSRDELLSMTVFDLDPSIPREEWAEAWEETSRLGSRYVETEHRTKSGKVFPVEVAIKRMSFGDRDYDCGFCRDISERKQAEDTQRRIQFSLDQVTDYLTWVDVEGRICEVSESTCRKLEYSRDELLGMTIFDISPTLIREEWPDTWEYTSRSGSRYAETKHRTKSGKVFPVEVAIKRMSFGDRDYNCGFCRDISERKALEESLRMTQLSVDQAMDMVHWVDADGHIVYANQSTINHLGYSQQELESLHLWDIAPGMSREQFSERWAERAGRGPYLHEATLRTKDGRLLPVDVSSNVVELEGKTLAVHFARDISERRQAEEALGRLQFSLDHIDDYPLWLDSEGRIVEVSESTCRHLEYSRDELLNMTIHEIDPGLGPEEWPDIWKRARKEGAYTVESEHQTKSGRVYPVEIANTYLSFGGSAYQCGFCRDISERKAMKESLVLTQLSVDEAPDPIFWVSSEGRFVYANKSVHALCGYSGEDLEAMHIWDWDPSLTPELFAERWRLAGEGPISHEAIMRTKDGQDRIVEISSSRLEVGGREIGVSFMRDVSERKLAEQSLRDSEERYRQLFELESDAILLAEDESGQILEVNEAAIALYGYSRAELLAMTDTALFAEFENNYPSDFDSFIDLALCWHRKKDGSVFPAEVHGRHFEWKYRRVRVMAIRDITDRVQAQRELEESRQMLQLVLDTVPLRVAWRDRDLRYMGCNIAMALDANLPDTASIVGKTDRELPHSNTILQCTEDDREVIQSGVPRLQYEEKTISSSGVPRIFRTSKVPLRDLSNEIIGVLSIYEDITEHKQTLQALQEREEQLRQSQKMEAIGRLAGGIAHDFNNVLTTIVGYSDLLLSSPECSADSLRQDIGEIKAAAERASSLTKQILAFSRRQALKPTIISLNSIISDTERLLARTLGADIDLRIDLGPDIGLAQVDEHQFVQILLNLAVNARDAMPQGGTLTLETANVELDERFCQTHPDAHPGGYVVLKVSDTGTGMDAETAARAFEPFYTTKPPGEGTGLGLSTVYGVIAQSGGCTYVHSKPGEGTVFTIYLPRVELDIVAGVEGGSKVDVTGGRETILVVDDDITIRTMIARVLEKRGYRVLQAGGSAYAVSILEDPDTPIDLLLTDVVLPGSLPGDQVAQVAMSLRPGLPALFMSAHPRDTIVRAGRITESACLLEKPFTTDDLVERVRETLDSSKADGDPTSGTDKRPEMMI